MNKIKEGANCEAGYKNVRKFYRKLNVLSSAVCGTVCCMLH